MSRPAMRAVMVPHHAQAPLLVAAPFEQYSGSFSAPFHENNTMAKADYQLAQSARQMYGRGGFLLLRRRVLPFRPPLCQRSP